MKTAFLLLVLTAATLARMGAECRKQADFFRDEKRTARFGLEAVQQCIWL